MFYRLRKRDTWSEVEVLLVNLVKGNYNLFLNWIANRIIKFKTYIDNKTKWNSIILNLITKICF